MSFILNALFVIVWFVTIPSSDAFSSVVTTSFPRSRAPAITKQTTLTLSAAGSADADSEKIKKSAPNVSGEQLELMLTEWDTPIVIDAYATWCGPCLLMSPEFEAAAKDMEGKVRFVKLDTDQEEEMASRLAINGLPTLLFLDQFVPPSVNETDASGSLSEEEEQAKAVLKGRIEGALRKEQIMELCEHYFFDGPEPNLRD